MSKKSKSPEIKCRLFYKEDNLGWMGYEKPVYTNLNGIFGYLSVSKMSVYFFWYDDTSKNVCCDDVSDKFDVEYVIYAPKL